MDRPLPLLTFPRRLTIIVCVGLLALLLGGCATVSLATLGTLADIAGGAATAGPVVFKMGKLDAIYNADFTTLQRAVRRAAYDLRLIVIDDPSMAKNPGHWTLLLSDNQNGKIAIDLQQRTPRLCGCRIDVGFFGSEPTASLILSHINAHLPASAAATPATMPAATQVATSP